MKSVSTFDVSGAICLARKIFVLRLYLPVWTAALKVRKVNL
jgi:hypothetical protein